MTYLEDLLIGVTLSGAIAVLAFRRESLSGSDVVGAVRTGLRHNLLM